MKRVLVCEGRNDAVVLRTLLAATDLADVAIMEGGGKSSALSLGTSIALQSATRVAIVVDADTTDLNRIQEQQSIFNDLQRRSPGSGACRLFLAVPTLEGELFPSPADFESVFNLRLTERQIERYRQDWNLVVRSFLSVPEANAATTIRTKGISAGVLRSLVERTFLRNLQAFLRETTA